MVENYIVRIYKRDGSDPDKVQGSLESVENETRLPFNTMSGLRAMLTPSIVDTGKEELLIKSATHEDLSVRTH